MLIRVKFPGIQSTKRKGNEWCVKEDVMRKKELTGKKKLRKSKIIEENKPNNTLMYFKET